MKRVADVCDFEGCMVSYVVVVNDYVGSVYVSSVVGVMADVRVGDGAILSTAVVCVGVNVATVASVCVKVDFVSVDVVGIDVSTVVVELTEVDEVMTEVSSKSGVDCMWCDCEGCLVADCVAVVGCRLAAVWSDFGHFSFSVTVEVESSLESEVEGKDCVISAIMVSWYGCADAVVMSP